ncbi:MAG: hypothetical protein IJB17_04330 [Oscillospiraceae bacterium]|nr:hypothetical protein [Oscillospiraceae bacterium]
MDEQDIQTVEPEGADLELDLDDILLEFASEDLPDAEEGELSDTQPLPNVLAETVKVEPVKLKKRSKLTGDTVRLEGLEQLREEPAPESEQPPQEEAPVPEPAPEPFTEQWQPDYENHMGEYVPPEPIRFQPRSRLRELKRKLIEGPEKRYYELSEKGLGKLQVLIFISLFVALLSAGVMALYAAGKIPESRVKLMVFGQFFALLLSALLGSHQLLDGVASIFRGRFTLNSMLVFTFAVCCADGWFCLREQRVPCCAAFSLQVTMSLWAAYHRRSTEMAQMDTLRKATRLDGMYTCPDYHDGMPGILRGDGEPEHFMDNYRRSSGPEKAQCWYAFIAMLLCIGCGVGAWLLHKSISFALQVTAAAALAAVPVASFVSLTRPMALQEKRLHTLGTVFCGWRGIRELCRRTKFPVTHSDLFPTGSCKLNGVKFYGHRDPDQVIAYAAALITADGGGLVPLFDHLVESRNCRRYKAQSLRAEGDGGIGGEVRGESVLVGDMNFLRSMGVDLPEETRVNLAVYIAIDGEFCGLVAVTYSKQKAAAMGISALCSRRSVRPVLVSNDFMLTESFIRSRFNVNTRRMSFPEYAQRQELSAKQIPEGSSSLALVTRPGLVSYACALTGARSLRRSSIFGVVVQILGGVLGLAAIAALMYLGETALLTPVNMLLYQLVWLVPGLLITEWAR